jgi:hypothetical protein
MDDRGWKGKREAMKALEFRAALEADDSLKVPPEIAAQIRGEGSVRVIVVVSDASEDRDWAQLTAQQFLDGYAPGDAIYDELPTEFGHLRDADRHRVSLVLRQNFSLW